jgi:hypothetical protein
MSTLKTKMLLSSFLKVKKRHKSGLCTHCVSKEVQFVARVELVAVCLLIQIRTDFCETGMNVLSFKDTTLVDQLTDLSNTNMATVRTCVMGVSALKFCNNSKTFI